SRAGANRALGAGAARRGGGDRFDGNAGDEGTKAGHRRTTRTAGYFGRPSRGAGHQGCCKGVTRGGRCLGNHPPHPPMSSAVLTPTASVMPPVETPLPVHLTRFVGRTTELQEIARMLASTRLLTLTGAGGSGKTRLAREAAAVASPDFTNVGWADLAPITDAALVPQPVATPLHL